MLRVFRHESHERFPRGFDTHTMMFPGEWGGPWAKGEDKQTDWFGVHWTPVPAMGQMTTETGEYIIRNLDDWRSEAKIPFDELSSYDWASDAARQTANWDRETQMGAIILLEGHFERLHSLMGFQEALMSFYESPDAMCDFFAELTKYKFECLRKIKEHYKPDVVIYHDDWGTQRSTFFDPAHWRYFIRPFFKDIVDECHRLGMYFELHSCGHITPMLGDAVEIGIDSIQTLQYPQNDIVEVKRLYGDKLVTRGGYDGQKIIAPGVSDDEIRETVRYSLRTLAPGGFHIPYVYVIGTGAEHPMAVMEEEVAAYEKELFNKQ
ncbi:MAG: hypothetical protein LBS51_05465 [Oscillospiraceae bacterium]|nr:hypothetical protein [Oscillospiraceae bacterium]